MAGAFEDYTIGWGGRNYGIPARRILEVVASIESVVTYGELLGFGSRGTAPIAKLSQAYGIILRAAGVQGTDGGPISDYEVYAGIGSNLPDNQVLDLVSGLFVLMAPPGATAQGTQTPGKSQGAAAATGSSKRSTKRSSVKAG